MSHEKVSAPFQAVIKHDELNFLGAKSVFCVKSLSVVFNLLSAYLHEIKNDPGNIHTHTIL